VKRRPKLPTPAERMQPLVGAIFSQPPGVIPPAIAEPWRAAMDARNAGQSRHRNREAGHDWPAVVDSLTAAGKAHVIAAPIRAAAVRAALAEVSPNHVAYAPAFIKWLRRHRTNM
jgi:hypothetical protein